jgi:hypothetical protein
VSPLLAGTTAEERRAFHSCLYLSLLYGVASTFYVWGGFLRPVSALERTRDDYGNFKSKWSASLARRGLPQFAQLFVDCQLGWVSKNWQVVGIPDEECCFRKCAGCATKPLSQS